MGLGTNRDYKTRDRAASINLAAHKILTDRLIAQGIDRLTASSQAFTDLMAMPFSERRAMIERHEPTA